MVVMMLMLSATVANAQQAIQRLFKTLLQINRTEIKARHTMEKDPETGKREGEMDLYDFVISSPTIEQSELLKNVDEIFEREKENAYSMNSGHYGNTVSLAVGKDGSTSVGIGNIKGSRYIYACFLDKDDPEKKSRYAYAMEWTGGDKNITVRLAKTYATIPKYRENTKGYRRVIINGQDVDISGTLNDAFSDNGSETWLAKFNTLRTFFMKKSEGGAANSWATQIYKLCKNTDPLDDAEKNMVVTEIKKLKAKTEDEFIQQLFDLSIERLKK